MSETYLPGRAQIPSSWELEVGRKEGSAGKYRSHKSCLMINYCSITYPPFSGFVVLSPILEGATISLQEQPTRTLTNQLGDQAEILRISKYKWAAVAELDAEGWFVDAWPPAAECLLPLSPVAAPLHSAPISHLRPPLARCTCVHTVSCFPLLLSDYILIITYLNTYKVSWIPLSVT